MIKLLEIREFDRIISNKDYKDDLNYKYLDKRLFDQLIDFIHEMAGSEDSEDVLRFMSITYKRNIGEVITIRNYVGVIQMNNGFQIQILPKISFAEEDTDNKATKKIFLRMLRSMKDFPSRNFNDASLKVDRMNLYELFINMYLQEVSIIIKKGLKSDYILNEDNLRYYKGKLLVGKNIVENLVHKERFVLSYDEFHPNRPENRLIKATLIKLQKLTNSFENSKRIRQLLISFEFVRPSINYDKDFSKIVIDRNNRDYELILKWSKVFLKNKSFSTFTGQTNSRALLFPMEYVYESYVSQQLKKIMIPAGFDVSSQDKGYYLFTEPKQQFALRPDIVIRKDNHVIVMDTKWKNLVNNPNGNYGIAQSDMYQMYAYSKKYKAKNIWLLYPINDEMRNKEDITFISDDNTIVNIHFIDLKYIENNLKHLRRKILKDLEQESVEKNSLMEEDKDKITAQNVITGNPTVGEVRKHIKRIINNKFKMGLNKVNINAGNIHDELNMTNAMPTVCNAMKTLGSQYTYEVKYSPPSGFGSSLSHIYKFQEKQE